MAIKDYSPSASLNTSISGINIGEGAPAGNMNNALRQLMADVKTGLYQRTFEDHGAVGDGAADDSAAIMAAITAAGGQRIVSSPGKTYLIGSQLLITGSLDLDLNGSTLKPSGNTALFTTGALDVLQAAVWQVTVSSGYTKGSRAVVVADATGLVVGQVVEFSTTDTNHDLVAGHATYPNGWNEIYAISGTTITLKYPLPVTYLTTSSVKMNAFAAATFKNDFRLYGGKIDGSASTYTTSQGNALRLTGFRRIFLDIEVIDFNRNTYELYPVILYRNLEVEATLRSRGTVTIRANFDIQECRKVLLPFVSVEGSGFGLSTTRCDSVQWGLIHLKGMSGAEVALEAVLGRATTFGTQAGRENGDILGNSTRGFKLTGCGNFIGGTLMGEGYETILRLSSCFSGHAGDIYAFNCGRDSSSVVVNLGNDSLAGTNMRGITFGNIVVVNATGSAFGIQSVPDDPQVSVGSLLVKRVTKHAIYALHPFKLGQAHIEDWALSVSVPAIQAREGGYFGPMVFEAADTAKTLFDGTLSAGKFYSFGPIRTNTTAGVFNLANRYNLDGRGTAAILTGTTSIVVTHNMMFSPGADDITITPTNNPTSDPGNLYVSAAAASNFTVSCRSDPGASGATFAWHVDNPDLLTT